MAERPSMGEWLAANWAPLAITLMFGWLVWENRAVGQRLDDIDKRLVRVETILEERIPRRPAALDTE